MPHERIRFFLELEERLYEVLYYIRSIFLSFIFFIIKFHCMFISLNEHLLVFCVYNSVPMLFPNLSAAFFSLIIKLYIFPTGGAMVSAVASQEEGPGFESELTVSTWVYSEYSGFFLQSINI